MHGSEEGRGELVVSGCNSPESLELTEETLDEVSFAIEGEVGFAFDTSAGVVRNDRGDSAPLQGFDQGVGVVSLVCEKRFRFDCIEKGRRLGQIVGLARSE